MSRFIVVNQDNELRGHDSIINALDNEKIFSIILSENKRLIFFSEVYDAYYEIGLTKVQMLCLIDELSEVAKMMEQ